LKLRQVFQATAEPIEYVYFMEQGISSVLTIMADGSAAHRLTGSMALAMHNKPRVDFCGCWQRSRVA
jgi:hypothetical protein